MCGLPLTTRGCVKILARPLVVIKLSLLFEKSAALEVLVDELGSALGIVLDVVTQGAVVEGTQLLDDTVDHVGTEDVPLLEGSTQLLQAFGTGDAAVGQAVEFVKAFSVGGIVDVDVHIGLGSEFEGILHLEAVAAGYAQASQQLIDVG